jgi:ribosomal protein S18 acetylase RimI-like enzyme
LPQRIVLVATRDQAIVGLIAAHLSHRFNRDAELQWLDVHPDFSRQGIATTLWACLAHWLVDHEAMNVLVNVEPDNQAARAFYAHQGAQEMNDHWMEWARLDRQLPAWPEGTPTLW